MGRARLLASSPTSPALQRLYLLDTSSSNFDRQFSDVLYGEEYIQCVQNLEDDDLDWLVNYLDRVFSYLEPSGPASRRCLYELSHICTTTSRFPTCYALPPRLLDISSVPFAYGGFSDVHRGTLDDSMVCIKRLRTGISNREMFVRMLHREAVAWKCLTHPNVVPFLGVVATSFQLVSVFMPGGTLSDYIKGHPDADRVRLLSDVARGLCHLHSFNVVHGGIKMPNILVDGSGNARIADFGESVVTNDVGSQEDWSEVGSTIRWAAPELLEGNIRSKKSDVYSFAMLMIETFTGAPPFSGYSPPSAPFLLLEGKRLERPRHPTFTENLWILTQQCWEHDPDLRPNAPEVLQNLTAPEVFQNSPTLTVPAWKQLTKDTLSTHQRVSLISSIFSHQSEIDVVELLSGNDAQAFIDVIDEVSNDLPRKIYWRCFHYSYRICGRQSLLPKSLAIPICYDPMETPQFHGGFADVWKGQYNGREVAAKALRISLSSNLDQIRRRFCKEVMTWNNLRHPNVLPLTGVTMTEQRFVMVSEWMGNGNINMFVKTNINANRLDLLGDVTKGLMYMHGQGIVHGDLKGANILIKNDGRACIADFSLLTIVADQQTFLSTCGGGGTTPWMSPELLDPASFGLQKCRLTRESDIYALGMVIYEVLSGLVPYAPVKVPVLKIVRGERPERPRGEQGAWFTDNIWGMLKRCWNPLPGDRPGLKAVFRCLGGGVGSMGAEVETDTDDRSDITTTSGSDLSIAYRSRVPKSKRKNPQKRGTSFHRLTESLQKTLGIGERRLREL